MERSETGVQVAFKHTRGENTQLCGLSLTRPPHQRDVMRKVKVYLYFSLVLLHSFRSNSTVLEVELPASV